MPFKIFFRTDELTGEIKKFYVYYKTVNRDQEIISYSMLKFSECFILTQEYHAVKSMDS